MGTGDKKLGVEFVECLYLLSAPEDSLPRGCQHRIFCEQGCNICGRAVRVIGYLEVSAGGFDAHSAGRKARRLEPFPLMPRDPHSVRVFENRETIGGDPRRHLALDCLAAGISAAHPHHVIEERIGRQQTEITIDGDRYVRTEFDRIEVVGAGKAAGVIAEALEARLDDWIDGGVVVTSHPRASRRIRQVEGAHPIPNERASAGGEAIRELAEAADAETLLIVVLTGGGSALLPVPAEPISLADLRKVTADLLNAGASIDELNAVRKHLSAVKGGRLAASAAPATVLGLLLSDVVGNDPSVIASGPLSPDPTTYGDAMAVLSDYDVSAPRAVRAYLARGRDGQTAETPGRESSVFENVSIHILADNETALTGAARAARRQGYTTRIISGAVEGEARTVGRSHADTALGVLAEGEPVSPPAVLLSGGETTVTVTGEGSGGPNQEVAVGAGLRLAGQEANQVVLASLDTDGIDGASDAAGGVVDGGTVENPDVAQAALDTNNTTEYLATRSGLLVTGFTGTNVNDLRVIVIGAACSE